MNPSSPSHAIDFHHILWQFKVHSPDCPIEGLTGRLLRILPYDAAVELKRVWGVAEDGGVVEVALAPALIPELERRWPLLGLERREKAVEPVEARFGLSDSWMIVPDREPSGTHPSSEAWDHLETELTLFAVSRLTRLVAVHSAAIAWKGKVLVVPGRPEAGKSTLALAAHEAGAAVLSDEYTLIDPDTGLVTGWGRSVRRRRLNGPAELIDIAVPSEPLPVGSIAIVHHDPGGDGWHPISHAQATIEVLSHTICSRSRPGDALDAVLKIASGAESVLGSRGEASEAIVQLLGLLEGRGEGTARE
ncbi:MAG: hypothetical protein E6Q57_08940 [Mycobacterium sp.]|nr:MAG: hypothetical protein E6Q57_08940 [Mycobacterium sp.]